MAYDPPAILSATTTQTTAGLLAVNASWQFTVSVPGTLATSCAVVTAQDAALLAAAPIVTCAAGSVTIKIALAVALIAGASKTFNIRVFV